jgi:hypothetical protein
MDVGKHLPDACNEGWNGTRAGISCHTPDDAQSTHDERGDRRLRAQGEVCGDGEKEVSLASELTVSQGNPSAPYSQDLKTFEDEEMSDDV